VQISSLVIFNYPFPRLEKFPEVGSATYLIIIDDPDIHTHTPSTQLISSHEKPDLAHTCLRFEITN
jgi:hypothetical protein